MTADIAPTMNPSGPVLIETVVDKDEPTLKSLQLEHSRLTSALGASRPDLKCLETSCEAARVGATATFVQAGAASRSAKPVGRRSVTAKGRPPPAAGRNLQSSALFTVRTLVGA